MNNTLLENIQNRLDFGKNKYGHGLNIHDDMSNYTRSKKDSFLEMQMEEILDGIIYTSSGFLRYINNKYSLDYHIKQDNNDDIIDIILYTDKYLQFNDIISLQYISLIKNMINVYNQTIQLQNNILNF